MSDVKKFHRWVINPVDLVDINEVKARDIIVKCFTEAQRETFYCASERMGLSTDPENIQETIIASIKLVFKQVGGDYDNPTMEALAKVVEHLAKAAYSWGTPEEIILHNKAQIEKVLLVLEQALKSKS